LDGDADGTAGGNYQRVFKIVSDTAPTLIGANPLANINEDVADSANPGTLVSALINGRVIEVDGPAQGIAITSADSSNGS